MEKKAFDLAVRYLSYRSRSEKEVKEYLAGKGYAAEEIQAAVRKLQDYGYQSDESFGKEFIRSKGEGAKKGSRFLTAKLKEKGLKEELIEKLINSEYPPEKEQQIAREECYRYFSSHQTIPMNQLVGKLYQRLIRKGFSSQGVHEALEALKNDPEVEKVMEDNEGVHFQQALAEAGKVLRKRESKKESSYQKYGAVYSTLARKGFSREVIKRVQDALKEME